MSSYNENAENNFGMAVSNELNQFGEIPEARNRRQPIPADIFVVDKESYLHVAFYDDMSMKTYRGMVRKMVSIVRAHPCMSREWSSKPGIDCIVQYNGRRGGFYVRGKIIETVTSKDGTSMCRDFIKCELIDDDLEVVVHPGRIFHTTMEISEYPKFTMKCRLDGMDIFVGHSFLKVIFDTYEQNKKAAFHENIPLTNFSQTLSSLCRFNVYILNFVDHLPVIRVFTKDGEDLTDVLQQYIPTIGLLEQPKFGDDMSVKLTHCDGKKFIWYRPMWPEEGQGTKTNLSTVVKLRLSLYNEGKLPTSSPNSRRNRHFQQTAPPAEEMMYLYKSEAQNVCYRIRKLYTQWKWKNGQAEAISWAFFVDHGFIQIVTEDKLVPAHLVDPNLSFIPPQCLPLRFIWTSCDTDGGPVVNIPTLWNYVKRHQVIITLQANEGKGATDSPYTPPWDQEDPPASYMDHSSNFPFPPGIPEEFRCSSGAVVENPACNYGNNLFSFDRPQIWIHCKKILASVVFREFIDELEKTGGISQHGVRQSDNSVAVPGCNEPRSLNYVHMYPSKLNILEKRYLAEDNDFATIFGGSKSDPCNPAQTSNSKPGHEKVHTAGCVSSSIVNKHSIPQSLINWAVDAYLARENGCVAGGVSENIDPVVSKAE